MDGAERGFALNEWAQVQRVLVGEPAEGNLTHAGQATQLCAQNLYTLSIVPQGW